MSPTRIRKAIFAGAILAALALGGCIGGQERDPTPGKLQLSASWQDAQHMDVVVKNVGGSPLPLSGMDMMQFTGPQGSMPIHWNGMAPTLPPGESRSFELHSMHMTDGTMGMTMDHAMAGDHMPMPAGDYMLRMGSESTMARLGR